MPTRSPHAQLLATSENASALAALRNVVQAVAMGSGADLPNPLFIHGNSGSGKTFLVQTFASEMVVAAGFEVCFLSANDFADLNDVGAARDADVLVVEDLQHLPTRFVAALISIIDDRANQDRPMIFTATQGPGLLTHRGAPLPRRLTNRLAAGLVVKLEPMQVGVRRRLLELLADNAGLHLAPDILDWLAKHLIGGGRQLQGAIGKLKILQRNQKKPLQLTNIQGHFDANGATSVQQIAERVSVCFQVTFKQLTSSRRSREIVLPRQVTMYLARRLTTMSLEQIGKYLGGRDHKTVQHACIKIESAIKKDAALSSTVRQLRAELS